MLSYNKIFSLIIKKIIRTENNIFLRNYDKTDNITDFSHFCLHDIYTDDELIKLKHLINYRHELRINHKYNSPYYNRLHIQTN